MVLPNRPERVSPTQRETKALDYRQLAILLREQANGDDAAGALLYEAAKQCINALASQRGLNPGTTGAKRRFLADVATEMSNPDLMDYWQSAADLHINADRLNMSEPDFEAAWTNAQVFINQMLQIYARGEPG